MLAQALVAHCESLKVYSFSRQYPSLLFPGASDRENDADVPGGLDISFTLDSINPLSWRRTASEIIAFKPDLVIIPVWTFFLAPCQRYLAIRCRKAGVHVRLFCHNVFDHDAAIWKSWLTKRLIRTADSCVTHSDEMAIQLGGISPRTPVYVHPHPIYEQYPEPVLTLPREAELELLFFGLIRPYKGLDIAIEAMDHLKGLSVKLRIVGEFWQSPASISQKIRAAGLDSQIEIVAGYVSDTEAAAYFSRADAVLLPYINATCSGVIPLAYRYGKPVVVTNLPGLTSVVIDGETGWIVARNDPPALAQTIKSKLTAEWCATRGPSIDKLKRRLSWNGLAEVTMSCLEPSSRP